MMGSLPRNVCILLGGNILPEVNLPRAVALLSAHLPVLSVSRAWQTPAVGSDGPDFLNAAVLSHSILTPPELKWQILRPLEARLGRVRRADKFAPRTIDLDVAVWGDQTLEENIWRYAFAAVPVAELLPNLRHPHEPASLREVAQKMHSDTPIQVSPDVTRQIAAQVAGQRVPATSWKVPGRPSTSARSLETSFYQGSQPTSLRTTG